MPMPHPKKIETFQTGYEKLVDQESLEYTNEKLSSRPAASRHDFFNYRVAFWVLSVVYIVTATFSFVAWSSMQNPDRPSSGMVDIPHDDRVVFIPDPDFQMPANRMMDDDPWGRLEPAGRGFIEVPVEVPLAEGGSVIEKQYYCISMFHQLHCIASLKTAFDSMTNTSHAGDDHPPEHLNHCFDYLRQAVMCAGDMTLEPAVEYKDLGRKGVAGWNVEHRCRNFQAMKDFAEDHRYLNSTGIL